MNQYTEMINSFQPDFFQGWRPVFHFTFVFTAVTYVLRTIICALLSVAYEALPGQQGPGAAVSF